LTLPLNILFPTNTEDLNNVLTQMYEDIAESINGSQSSWTPTVSGSTTTGTGTYSSQEGVYYRNGILVDCWFNITMTAHTGAGNIRIKLPLKIRSGADIWVGECLDSNVTYPSGTKLVLDGINDTLYCEIVACGDGISSGIVQLSGTETIKGHLRYIGVIDK